MPTYEYECGDCKNQFEVMQNITDDTLKDCPKCGGHARRLISTGAGIIFKGKGFYQTDYKKSPEKKETKPATCGKTEKCACCESATKE